MGVWLCCWSGDGVGLRVEVESRWSWVAGVAPRDRSCARRERWDRKSFRAVARGGIRVSTFQCSLRPDPAAAGACVVGGYLSVFWDLTLGFKLCRWVEVFGWGLRCRSGDGVGSRVWLRGIGPALAGNVGTGRAFALSREGGSGCRRSNARSDPIPLPPVRAWWVAICRSFGI